MKTKYFERIVIQHFRSMCHSRLPKGIFGSPEGIGQGA
ncbi:hypothetical protein SAMN06298210_11231 [Prevotellaceae bacterium KH2P17]|nr:hypothetical protein SAMN06298210_11231 [Prevotellaceae bacterium KH2P17]